VHPMPSISASVPQVTCKFCKKNAPSGGRTSDGDWHYVPEGWVVREAYDYEGEAEIEFAHADCVEAKHAKQEKQRRRDERRWARIQECPHPEFKDNVCVKCGGRREIR
jgi:hypothetical protein